MWEAGVAAAGGAAPFWQLLVAGGVFYHLYNQVGAVCVCVCVMVVVVGGRPLPPHPTTTCTHASYMVLDQGI